ncbi:MAG: class II fumarate hydratase [Sulfurimonadaceae bacterium]|nr:class II fumarate hydratase [Sulfurimonadaceae bacterium]
MPFRTEQDSMGSVKIPVTAHYGAQTQRAVDNFPVSGMSMPWRFIESVILIKESAAAVNSRLELLDADVAKAIEKAARSLREKPKPEQFPVDVFQTGSGTSTNMNVNEVIAHIASEISGLSIHPNDHVNMGQSSNDVIPTAIHISAVTALNDTLFPALEHLCSTIETKASGLQHTIKTGRTHLMDAMPLTMAQELSGWSAQIGSNIERLRSVMPRLYTLAQGGTAVGTGVNSHPKFSKAFVTSLSKLTHLPFQNCANTFESISSQDTAVELSGQLKTLAVSMMKIANDLRWMNSGPLTGLGEIELEALQPGSSIMPGKVNPVIPESVAMVCAKVIGNDTTVTVAGQSGNFQLNVMLPLIAHTLLESIEILSNAAKILADRAISGFTVNDANLHAALAKNPILVTALNPIVGYEKAAAIAKKAYAEKRPILDVADEMTDIARNELEKLLDPKNLTR